MPSVERRLPSVVRPDRPELEPDDRLRCGLRDRDRDRDRPRRGLRDCDLPLLSPAFFSSDLGTNADSRKPPSSAFVSDSDPLLLSLSEPLLPEESVCLRFFFFCLLFSFFSLAFFFFVFFFLLFLSLSFVFFFFPLSLLIPLPFHLKPHCVAAR
jgi:hypothetical protein